MKGMAAYRRGCVALVALAVGLAAAAPTAFAQSPNPGVLPPQSRPYGASYGEWSARWWQWLVAIPEVVNPNLDTTGANCAQGQTGRVWFLAGTFGGTFVRSCTVPAGQALLFPILTGLFGAGAGDCAPTGMGPCNIAALRAAAAAQQVNPMLLSVTVDNVPLQNESAYRVQSPVFDITWPAGALFGFPSGTFSPNVADGYFLMLAPLSRGRHTIHIKGVANNGFTSEVTYNLTVQ
jgi:hypothetical protein